MPGKKYLVTLDTEEREHLEHLLHSGTHASRNVRPHPALLWVEAMGMAQRPGVAAWGQAGPELAYGHNGPRAVAPERSPTLAIALPRPAVARMGSHVSLGAPGIDVLYRTTVYVARTVVWEGGGREASPYPDERS